MRMWLHLHKTSDKHVHVLTEMFITNQKILQKKHLNKTNKLDNFFYEICIVFCNER